MNIKDLKKRESAQLAKLKADVEKSKSRRFQKEEDPRFWKPTLDKAGNGSAVIRFLPPCEAEQDQLPYVKYFRYNFKGPGGLYIEKSRRSIGDKDPVYDYNGELFASGVEENIKFAKEKSNQKTSFISNILIIKDPAKPENEGKVFLYEYGVKIFNKIEAAMNGRPDLDEAGFNPFGFMSGANFSLQVCKVADFPNYDQSSFGNPKPLFDGDEDKLLAVYKQLHPLQPFLDPANFKSYADLQARLARVLNTSAVKNNAGAVASPSAAKTADTVEDDDLPFADSNDDELNTDSSSDIRFLEELAEKS